ncbi:IS66 family insertion sequence element accessory protein TnpA [Aminobacter sp. UC22_36]|uniref:IS66 family insertion sequence element accessory protein TnpA n=1 Tax=Aminobacter sp. UC22_36 TaxID=3374549 RepID=UPI003757E90B
MWGSFVAWRISGEFETFREHGTAVLLVVHVKAWRQSGLARTTYCRHHYLNRRTFERWLGYLMGKEAARKHAES